MKNKENHKVEIEDIFNAYKSKNYKVAEKLTNTFLKNAKNHPIAWKIYSALLGINNKKEEALIASLRAMELAPNDPEVHNNLGNAYRNLRRYDESEEHYNKAITLDKNFATGIYNLGISYKELGKFEASEKLFKQVITLNPEYFEAYRHLSDIRRFVSPYDKYLLKMLELFKSLHVPNLEKIHLGFGIAKAYDDLGLYKNAFEYYQIANSLRNKEIQYDQEEDNKLFRNIKERFLRDNGLSIKLKIQNNIRPIFIVGMPRSGTTLVEQIISSHSEVFSGGELPFLSNFVLPIIQNQHSINDETILSLRKNYFTELEKISKNYSLVTDKMPHNFLFLGVIQKTFPEAAIIHVTRKAEAICWSNYSHYFQKKSLGYAYDLNNIINYYKLYEDLLIFWNTHFSSKIYTLDYDLLTKNQEYEIKKL